MQRSITPVVVLVSLLGAGCACCGRKDSADSAGKVTPAPRAETPNVDEQSKAPARILGLDPGWELAPGGASYSASQTPAEAIIKASGEHPTGGYETKLVMSPLRIYPPQWMLAVKKPAGPVTQVITPFEVTASSKANEPIKAIHVSDAAGKHLVPVEQAPRLMRESIAFILIWTCVSSASAAEELPVVPVVPVGLDAYRQWDKWPLQRIGVRAYMRSTYDRAGRNEGADAGHFLYQQADDFNVTLDVQGKGILYFARYNHWHGSPWHYVVDGKYYVVQESSTPTPEKPVANSTFEPRAVFPKPLAWTWSDTKGADLSWVPIPFERSFTMAYSRTHYGTGYYIYHRFVPGIPLSQPIKAWDGKQAPDRNVLELIGRSGTDIAPPNLRVERSNGELFRGGFAEGLICGDGPGVVRAIHISAPRAKALALDKLRIQARWEHLDTPSIDAPLPLFFGAGTMYNRDGREYLVKAFPVSIRYDPERVRLACYFPMPFIESGEITLVDPQQDVGFDGIDFSVHWEPTKTPPAHVAHFHATYRDHGPDPKRGHDLVLLDTQETEGGGDWSGSFIGTSFIFSHNANLTTLEGDPRFYFDDSKSPQAYGTGTEEWGGGGDYWGGRNMTLPFAGHPCGAPSLKEAKNDLDKIQSAYRFLLADLMPFGKNARITLEHGGENESKEH